MTSNRPQPWRRWYATKAWQVARVACFVRDRFVCRRCGHGETRNRAVVEAMIAGGMTVDAVAATLMGKVSTRFVCDHVEAHRGSERLFWDPANHQAMCKACHDRHKQADEQASLQQRGVWY
jgi:5-methylcytosine-specific restriction enzyme A